VSSTYTCDVCQREFLAQRSHARYCSATCRQKRYKALISPDLDTRIAEARDLYWRLVRQEAGISPDHPNEAPPSGP
jgi:hypothetical protein